LPIIRVTVVCQAARSFDALVTAHPVQEYFRKKTKADSDSNYLLLKNITKNFTLTILNKKVNLINVGKR